MRSIVEEGCLEDICNVVKIQVEIFCLHRLGAENLGVHPSCLMTITHLSYITCSDPIPSDFYDEMSVVNKQSCGKTQSKFVVTVIYKLIKYTKCLQYQLPFVTMLRKSRTASSDVVAWWILYWNTSDHCNRARFGGEGIGC